MGLPMQEVQKDGAKCIFYVMPVFWDFIEALQGSQAIIHLLEDTSIPQCSS